MRRLARIVLVGLCGYLMAWGATWLAGDKSSFQMEIIRGGSDVSSSSTTYPGVFLGGLPPIPNISSEIPQLVAVLVGVVGLVLLIAIPLAQAVRRGARARSGT